MTDKERELSPTFKATMFGLNGFFTAAHAFANDKILSDLGEDGAAASTIVTTVYSVVLGVGVGILLATGLDFTPAYKDNDYELGGRIVRTSYVLTAALGLASAAVMLASSFYLPKIYHADNNTRPAYLASDFFMGYSAAPLGLLYLIMITQVAFTLGDWFIPPLSMMIMAGISATVSYLLEEYAGLGAIGVGLGGEYWKYIHSFSCFIMVFK
jgi:Na+-driven multidrug efflux pump